MDVSKIVLTGAEQAAFDLFRHTDTVVLTSEQFRLLAAKGLVQKTVDGAAVWFSGIPDRGECRLSNLGKDLQAFQLQQKRTARRESRRYWITTVIAIVALIKSFMPELSSGWAFLWNILAQQPIGQ